MLLVLMDGGKFGTQHDQEVSIPQNNGRCCRQKIASATKRVQMEKDAAEMVKKTDEILKKREEA